MQRQMKNKFLMVLTFKLTLESSRDYGALMVPENLLYPKVIAGHPAFEVTEGSIEYKYNGKQK